MHDYIWVVQARSYITTLLCCLSIVLIGLCYYPKWEKPQTEATLSWDVSGYYMYLPAAFIYQDIKGCEFQEDILKQYQPTYDFQQAFLHPSGNYVMKYPMGMALIYAPAFAAAHGYARISNAYPADGFSRPYQLAIYIWNFLIVFIGLFALRRILLHYFDNTSVAITIVLIALGSNYLNYTAIDGAMTHNYLFTLYALLIETTIRWQSTYQWKESIIIGALIGIMALIRPTEIIAIIIPFTWSLRIWKINEVVNRLLVFKQQLPKILTACIVTLMIGGLQLCYWKYATGEWVVYSYQNQGFSWLHPHVHDGLLSYKSGWLVYSPIMIFGLIGLYFLSRVRTKLFSSIFIFLIVFTYIVTAWDIWWYGGSLGNRAMIQSYPIWAFGMAAFANSILRKGLWPKTLITVLSITFIYFNLWFTHQAHHGGLIHAGAMTKAYFWKVLGTYEGNPLDTKLLDTDEAYYGDFKNTRLLYRQDFEDNTEYCDISVIPISGARSLCLHKEKQYTNPIVIPLNNELQEWIRVSADYKTPTKQWDVWKMTQCQVSLYKDEEIISSKMIRIQRHLHDNVTNHIWIDLEIPNQQPDQLKLQWWNADSDKTVIIDNVTIESFDAL